MKLEDKRTELFRTGSTFKPANRDDIAGIDSTLEQIDIIVYWLKNSQRFTEHNSRLQPGLLFEGRPGTGKTLCARYIATASDALFIDLRDWPLENEVVSSHDLADLFGRARRHYQENQRPVILFWDEFEGYAADRSQAIGNNMRQVSVVSQLTAEMDGIHGKAPGVLFIGCTNYRDSIDDALLRPGRMGLHIRFNSPDQAGKAKLLKHYMSHVNTAPDLDYASAAFFFENLDTAATVEEAVQRVWLQTVFQSMRDDQEPVITTALANSVLLNRLIGPAPPFMDLQPDSYFRVAVHELGHALVAERRGVPVQVITIQPGEASFGRTFLAQPFDKLLTVDDQYNQVCVTVGSAYAERLMGLPQSAAIHMDTARASRIAIQMADGAQNRVMLTFDAYDTHNSIANAGPSEWIRSKYDERAIEVMASAQAVAEEIIKERGRDLLVALANRLVIDKTWTGPQFYSILADAS